eukprot:CAMPEP_0114656192 /NCGR_PEP_ID=MMETSP0191-20121206/11952_1 /TAXON_ID=126664 /ORGANISM="Sorites sp." /LENGTH=409 /DNA_ID=CAMNT_0001872869 /DNA_START=493 /DNA_END=1722 /DNA_ORIENTATION=+
MKSFGWHTTLPNAIDFEMLLGKGDTTYQWPMVDETSGCLLNYTSGTTGYPKGVVQSHRAVCLTMLTVQFASDITGSSCVLALPPMFHACGWYLEFITLMKGNRLLLPYNCYDFTKLMNWALKERCDFMCGVPTMINGLVSAMKANPKKFEAFRGRLKFGTGGTAIPGHLVKWLYNNFDIEVLHLWAMTECLPGTISRLMSTRSDISKTPEERVRNITKQGKFACILESKLVDPDTRKPVKKNDKDVGELLVRGPCVTAKYFKGMGVDKFDDGWLKTGDIAKVSQTDEMTITDRAKDLIKSGGEWISSVDLENYISTLSEVEFACVVAAKHPKWIERPVCIIQLKPGKTLTKEKVLAWTRKKFAKFQTPDDVLFWDEIPMTGTGKLSKKDVRAKLEAIKYVLPSLKQSKL